MLSSAVVDVTPSRMFNSAAVAEIAVPLKLIASKYATPSMYRSFHSAEELPISRVLSPSGIRSAPRVPDTITLPDNVIVPAMLAAPAIFKSLNFLELEPKSISLLVVGSITPSLTTNCSVLVPLTSILNSTWLFVSSTTTLFLGVATPGSPINPMTGPSAAVPSCL